MPALDNVEMYKYTKFYQNSPCGSRVISVFANCSLTALERTHAPIIVQTCGLCNLFCIKNYICDPKLSNRGIHYFYIHNKKSKDRM